MRTMTTIDDLYEQLEALERTNAYTPIAHTCGYPLKKLEVPRPDYISKHYYDIAHRYDDPDSDKVVSCPKCGLFLYPTEEGSEVPPTGTKRVYKGWIRLRAEIGDGPDDILFLLLCLPWKRDDTAIHLHTGNSPIIRHGTIAHREISTTQISFADDGTSCVRFAHRTKAQIPPVHA